MTVPGPIARAGDCETGNGSCSGIGIVGLGGSLGWFWGCPPKGQAYLDFQTNL
jgi:hypothetical protein